MAANIVIGIGAVVLVGWIANIGVFKSVLPGLVTMKPNAAVSFVLTGVALRLITAPTTPKHQRLGQLCGLGAAVVGLVTLSQDIWGWNLGIDQLLFSEHAPASGTLSPGRMSPLTAFCFMLGGSALGLSGSRRRSAVAGGLCWSEVLAVLVTLVATQVLVAYLYGAQPVIGLMPYTQMGLHTAISFMVLAAGILMARPQQGLIGIVAAEDVGGSVARRLLPAAIAVPLLLGGFRIATANLGLFAPDLGTSLLAVLHAIIFAGVVLWTARQLHRVDRQRQAALQALAQANEDLEARIEQRTAKLKEANRFFNLSHELIAIVGPNGYFKQLNPAWESVLGFSQAELLAQPFLSFVHPEDLERTRAALVCFGMHRAVTTFENRYRCRDGSYKWLSWVTVVATDDCLTYLTARDVTDRKQAEQQLMEQTALTQRQADLLELTNEAIFVRDQQGAITYWNRGAERLYGWSRQEALGQVPHVLLQTQKAWQPSADLDVLVQQQGLWQGELNHTCKNGQQIIVESRQVLISDPQGGATGFLEVNRDISDRKRSEAALRESEERFRRAILEAPLPVMLHAEDGEVLQVNHAWCELTGYSPAELRTTADWSEKAYGSRQQGVNADIERLHRLEHRVAEGEYWVRTRFGETRVWEFYSAPLGRLLDGRSLVISTAIDVTKRQQAEAELQQLNATLEQRVEERTAQLQETNRVLESFSYTVAHDLRAPLRGIQGFAQALVEDYGDQLDATARQYIQAIFEGTNRMNDLVRDLLAYSRLSREQVRLTQVQLSTIVDAARLQLAADLQQCSAEVTIAPNLPNVTGHSAILVQIVVNLLSNAVKFVDPGKQPQVRVWAEPGRNANDAAAAQTVRLWVEDNGIGIAPEYQEQVFGVFERLHSRDAYPGTGIGLAIVKKGAERLGGRAGVESVPGQGSRFWIELQRAP